jgi:hypothetical protein
VNRKILLARGAIVAALTASACVAASKSENPLTPTVAGPIPGVDITAPSTVHPGNGAKIPVAQQPMTLTVSNASTSGVRPLNYLFEIATDINFSNIVYSSGSVGPGDGQTSVRLQDALAADRSYYWRARAQDGANTGPFSAPSEFLVVNPVVFQAPGLVSPIDNVVVGSLRPRFTWNNAPRSGSPDSVTYLIQLSDTSSFALSVSATVPEQPGQTSIDTSQDLPSNRQGFWRVQASDGSTTGPWSATQAFRTPAISGGGVGSGGNEGGVAGCSNGRLNDPKAYFFALIGRSEGSPANDWPSVLAASGIPNGNPPGVQSNPRVHYGITQQIGAGGPRGVLYLPTDAPDDLGYYTRQILVIDEASPGSFRWAWIDRFIGGPPYVPRPCP